MQHNMVSERKRSGLSRKEVAEQMNCSEDVIGKWERGETSPRLKDAVKLSTIYGCSIDYLSGASEERVKATI